MARGASTAAESGMNLTALLVIGSILWLSRASAILDLIELPIRNPIGMLVAGVMAVGIVTSPDQEQQHAKHSNKHNCFSRPAGQPQIAQTSPDKPQLQNREKSEKYVEP